MTLFCGAGVAGTHAEVMALAAKLHSPIGHLLRGKEWIQFDNPYDAPLELAIHGDITATLRAVLPLLTQKIGRSFLDRMLHQHEKALTHVVDAYTHNVEHHVTIHPEYAARILDDLAAEDAVFTQTQPHRQAVHHQPSRHRRPRL